MNRRRRGQMRSPFKQANISSSSLEGMEKPVRSFKSFVQTVPPNPSAASTNKPLPSTPAIRRPTPPSPAPTLARTSSDQSWKTPAEWANGPSDKRDSLSVPRIPSRRQYSPLLPEPSPDLSERYLELRVSQSPSSPSPRLKPIYERRNAELGPPRSPPKSPPPMPPRTSPRSPGPETPPKPQVASSPPPRPSPPERRGDATPGHAPIQAGPHAASPTHSTNSQTSMASTNKAFASLGIDPPWQQAVTSDEVNHPTSSQHDLSEVRADRSYLRDRKLRALNKGDPLADNSWEDSDMDEKTRQRSYSQDYHDLLVDQYQEMSVRPEEVLWDATRDRPYAPYRPAEVAPYMAAKDERLLSDHELMPPPLSWRKSSIPTSSRGTSETRDETAPSSIETPSTSRTKRLSGKIATWVPYRLSVGPKRAASKNAGGESIKGTHRDRSEAKRQVSAASKDIKPMQIPDWEVNQALANDLRFSTFFPTSYPLRFNKREVRQDDLGTTSIKYSNTQPQRAPSLIPTPKPPTPLMRLPGGLVVFKTPRSEPRSEEASIVEASSTGGQPRSASSPGSQSHHSAKASSPTSNPSEQRSSYHSQYSNPVSARALALRNRFRNSVASSHSQYSTDSAHPLAQNVSSSLNSQGSRSTGSWRSSSGDAAVAWRKPGFLGKAREARRKHRQESRQEKLRKSIKVLGPTDPGVVSGYVKRPEQPSSTHAEKFRMPGYMVNGAI